MKKFSSILTVIPSRPSQPTLRTLVWNSMHWAQWLKSEVYFLTDISETQSIRAAIAEFKHSRPPAPSTLILHPSSKNGANPVLDTIQRLGPSLIILQDGAVLHSAKGTDERMLLELSPRPVLLIPKYFDFGKHPLQSFLVPLSGENRLSEALSVSLRLAEQTSSDVDFLHIMNPAEPCTCGQALETLGDELHHEYSRMLENISAAASPYSTTQERRHLRHFFHCTGFTAAEVAKLLIRSPGALLVLEWNGSLALGRAKTIKDILHRINAPILFVKTAHEQKSTLRVGKQLST